MADIDLGRVFEALNNKLDMPTGVSQSNIDYVVESQLPTASNNYTWYRKYKSGWVEQGGKYDNGSLSDDFTVTITLPVTMKDSSYTLTAFASRNTNNFANRAGYTTAVIQTETSIGIGYYRSASGNQMQYINWQVSGMGASE